MIYYLYEHHMGGLYWTVEKQEYEDLYCDTCGDCDWLAGEFETVEELKELMVDSYLSEDYKTEFLKEFIGEFV